MTIAETIPLDEALEMSVGNDWPAALDDAAFHGLAGDLVRTIDPHTEADPVAILVQFLVAFGNAVGRGPHFLAEADRHGPNLFAVCVGETAKGRKGTSWGQARRIVEMADESWPEHIVSGLSSGEGIIWQVRDPIEKQEAIKEKGRVTDYQTVVVDEGVVDKRLLVFEGEFAGVLRVLSREGNTLSAVIRNAWDTGNLRTLTKNSPAVATGAHISIIGHITRDELLRHLSNTEAANGFANRFLWLRVRRSKLLPEGGSLSQDELAPLIQQVQNAQAFALSRMEMRRDDEARAIWHAVYAELSEGQPGMLGAITARAEAQVMRLALIYALLDMSAVIGAAHLRAALAVWEYAEASAEFIFGDRMGDPNADRIIDALKRNPSGLTRTEIRDLFNKNLSAERIEVALAALLRSGNANCLTENTNGRPAERWVASNR